MKGLQLRLAGPQPGDELVEILQSWLAETPWATAVSEADATDDQALVVLAEGDRRVEVRLRQDLRHRERWKLEIGAWLVPAEPARGWSALMGFAVFAFGLAISYGYLGWSTVAFWLGVLASLVIGVVVGRVAWRHAVRDRVTTADRARADEVLDTLEPLVRSDHRVQDVKPL